MPNAESLRAIWDLAKETGIQKARPEALLERLEGFSADLFPDGAQVFQALMTAPQKERQKENVHGSDRLRRIGDEFLRAGSSSAGLAKREGRYYTPVWVIDKILELLWADIFPDNEFNSRSCRTFCDPSMGCGYFFLRLVELAGVSFGVKLPELREWVGHCFYGVDKDPASVFMTRALLWLCLSDRDGEFVPDNMHFVCGEALLGDGFGCSRQSRLDPFERKSSVDWNVVFPEIASVDGFDIIAGNPPYEVLTNFQTQTDKKWFADALRVSGLYFDALTGQINLYRCFIERSLNLLKPGGIMSFVVPMSLTRDLSAESVRRHLINSCSSDRWLLYGEDEGIFPGISQAACIFRARAFGGKTPVLRISMGHSQPETLDVEELEDGTNGTLLIPSLDPEGLAVLRWFWQNPFGELADVADSHVGEVDQTFFRDCMSDQPTGCILARGTHLSPFYIDVADVAGKERYLKRDLFLQKKGAMAASCQERVKGKRLAQLGIRNLHSRPRLVAAILPEGVYAGNSLNIFYPWEGVSLQYLAGMLNSRILDWYFRIGSANNNINLHEMRTVPFPLEAEERDIRAVEEAYVVCEKLASAGKDEAKLAGARQELDRAVAACFAMPDELFEQILKQ